MFCEHLLRCCHGNFVRSARHFVWSGLGNRLIFGACGVSQSSNFHRLTFAEKKLSLQPSRKRDLVDFIWLFCSRRFYGDVNRFQNDIFHSIGRWSPQLLSSQWSKVPQRTMAGHSKWQNIKHIKEAKDAEKANTFSKLSRQIKVAVQMGKSADPRFNNQLAHLVEVARQANMPISKIEALIKGSESSKDVMTSLTIEAMGPGGCFIIIEVLTDKVNRARNNLKYVLSRVGTTIVDGSAAHAFKYKGVVHVDPSGSNLTLENAVDLAIEVGAEDVVDATEDDGQSVLQFQCEPREFYNVKTALASKSFAVRSSGLRYLPQLKVSLNDDQLNVMSRVCEVLEEHPDVVKFYDNIE